MSSAPRTRSRKQEHAAAGTDHAPAGAADRRATINATEEGRGRKALSKKKKKRKNSAGLPAERRATASRRAAAAASPSATGGAAGKGPAAGATNRLSTSSWEDGSFIPGSSITGPPGSSVAGGSPHWADGGGAVGAGELGSRVGGGVTATLDDVVIGDDWRARGPCCRPPPSSVRRMHAASCQQSGAAAAFAGRWTRRASPTLNWWRLGPSGTSTGERSGARRWRSRSSGSRTAGGSPRWGLRAAAAVLLAARCLFPHTAAAPAEVTRRVPHRARPPPPSRPLRSSRRSSQKSSLSPPQGALCCTATKHRRPSQPLSGRE